MKISPKVWKNGEFIDWDDARIHVMSHVVNYGSSVFEGIRCYKTSKGFGGISPDRTYAAAHQFGKDLSDGFQIRSRRNFATRPSNWSAESGLDECYIRPIVIRGLDEKKPAFGVNPFPNPIDAYIATWQWGKYLGEEALESASTSAFRAGHGSPQTRCPRWQRPARII